MKKKTIRTFLWGLSLAAFGACALIPQGSPAILAGLNPKKAITVNGETYQADYSTIAAATEAAEDLSNEAAAEGTVLLKNQNQALPLSGHEGMTVFGDASDFIAGFRSTGYKVFKASTSDSTNFSTNDTGNFRAYNDVAVIVLSSGTAGEGQSGGMITSEVEDNKDVEGQDYGYGDGSGESFKHRSLATDSAGKEYKHGKQVGDATEKLIAYAHENFGKVIVILTCSTTMEIGSTLKANPKVDAVLHTGTLGSSGWQGTAYGGYALVGKLLDGEITPSGRTNDLWAWDFTANPSWANDGNSGESFDSAEKEAAFGYNGIGITRAFRTSATGNPYAVRGDHAGSNRVNNFYAVEYEEDIYNGYRYYETAAAEASLANYAGFNYNHAVAYPFGYGLSYTTFTKEILTAQSDVSDWGKDQADYTKNGRMKVAVKVTNTGKAPGKEVVEIYGHSPYYLNGVAKTENVLLGFAKTGTLNPGASQTVVVEVKIADMASFDYNDANGNGKTTYEIDKVAGTDTKGNPLHDGAGHYELRVQESSHFDATNDKVLTLSDPSKDIILSKDLASGKEVSNVFSQKDAYNLLSSDPGDSGKTLVEQGKMKLMSRANFTSTFPTAPKSSDASEMVRSDQWFKRLNTFANYEADNFKDYDALLEGTAAASEDASALPWAVSDAKFAALGGGAWKQGEATGLKFRDLIGVDVKNTTVAFQNSDKAKAGYTTNAKLVGMTGSEAWTKLINTMTYDEMAKLVSNGAYQSLAVSSIEKPASRYMDSALVVDQELWSAGFNWGDCCHYAATFNHELLYRRGVISGNIALLSEASSQMSSGKGLDGWYAPAMDLHRSPFGGRNSEYFSEDPILSGTASGEIVAGMAAKGIICTIKHVAMNENETQRIDLLTYASEQCARELYFKGFQLVLEDYKCGALMTSYNCIGDVHSDSNYAFVQKMIRDEWGFDGFATSDAVSPASDFFTMDSYLRAGSSLLLSHMSDPSSNLYVSGAYDATANCVKLTDGSKSNTQWASLRQAAQQILYTEVNSAVSSNGIDLSTYTGAALADGLQGKTYSASVAFTGSTGGVYTLSDGALPEGCTLRDDGTISGVPTVPGDYSFSVACLFAGYIKGNATFTIKVTSSFSLDNTANPVKGSAYDAYVNSTYFTTGNFDSVSYAVNNNSLPAGLSMDATGHITGTPTTAGTYQVSLLISGSKTSTGGWGPGGPQTITTVTKVNYDFTMVVEGQNEDTTPMTRSEVEALVKQLTNGTLTEAEIQAIVDKAVAGQLTQSQVEALIQKALAAQTPAVQDNKLAITGVVLSSVSLAAMIALIIAVILKKKKA